MLLKLDQIRTNRTLSCELKNKTNLHGACILTSSIVRWFFTELSSSTILVQSKIQCSKQRHRLISATSRIN